MRITLKGIFTVKAKGHTYHYAWRGGPRLTGEPGTPEFIASYNEAAATLRAPDASRFKSLIVSYKSSPDWRKLADSTRKEWSRWLDRIGDYFGELRVAQFDRPEKIRPIIRQWRNQWADKPRTADYGMQVLSRLLSHAVEDGRIAGNPCEGIKALYSGDRAEIIWTDSDIAQLRKAGGSHKVKGKLVELPCPPEVMHAADLAAHTGLRLGDLVRLSWSHIGDDAITLATGKSRGRREAIIPLYDGLRDVLANIPKCSTTILTSSSRRPWTTNGFSAAFQRAKKAAGMTARDLHFHDLRGTAATRFYIAGLPVRIIAEILAWSEDQVDRIIRRYVDRAAATKAAIRLLNEARAAKPEAERH
jgi:integrase